MSLPLIHCRLHAGSLFISPLIYLSVYVDVKPPSPLHDAVLPCFVSRSVARQKKNVASLSAARAESRELNERADGASESPPLPSSGPIIVSRITFCRRPRRRSHQILCSTLVPLAARGECLRLALGLLPSGSRGLGRPLFVCVRVYVYV